jgi:1-acyl-sn-glycerol-3-phosphate acyltransferase
LVRFFRSVFRSVKLVAIFAFGGLELAMTRPATREQRAEWLHRFCARAVRAMGITARHQGTYPERGIVISNHLGYLDIMVFAALHRCVFVSKAEIQNWFFLGWMTTMSGTVYVERGRGGSASQARSGMEAAADAGIPVVLFPEGTSSNGETVLKFHTGLLWEGIEAGQPVTAAHIRYRLTEDNGPDVTVANSVAYWDDTPLLKHIFRVVALRGIEVDVKFAPAPIAFSAAELNRKSAAVEARAAVMEVGGIAEREPVAI